MVLLSTIALLFCAPQNFLPTMTTAATDCLTLAAELLAVYTIWLGLLELLDACGLTDKLAKLLAPVVKKLFATNDQEAIKLISIALSANFLGMGNAATPAGIKAMKQLDDKSGKANFSMTMFMILSCCSIQLLPTTIMGLRTTAGSNNAADIILPILLSSIISTTCGIALGLIFKPKKQTNSYSRY